MELLQISLLGDAVYPFFRAASTNPLCAALCAVWLVACGGAGSGTIAAGASGSSVDNSGLAGSGDANAVGGAAPASAASGAAGTGAAGSSSTGGTEATPVATVSQRYEAELGALHGTRVATSRAGFSGMGYVAGFTNDAAVNLSIEVTVPSAGVYELGLGYASEFGDKQASIALNGTSMATPTLAQSTAFAQLHVGRAFFAQGKSTITIGGGYGYYEIDYITLDSFVDHNSFDIAPALVTAGPSPEAAALYAYLRSVYRKRIISGQYTLADNDYVLSVTGKHPAITGFDFMPYSPAHANASDPTTQQAIAWYNEQNGIVAFVWHWWSPAGETNDVSKNCPWYRSFYAQCTTFDVSQGVIDGTPENALILRDIDAIAAQIQALSEAKVPILFRPLHEAEGGWFWWGAKGPAPAVALYKLLFERLTMVHHLHNIIWIWNSLAEPWYPGDQYLDVIAADLYNPSQDYDPSSEVFDAANRLVNGKRLVALSENGPIPDPEQIQAFAAYWSYFGTWSGDFVRPLSISTEQLQTTYRDPFVVTLDDLPSLKTFH